MGSLFLLRWEVFFSWLTSDDDSIIWKNKDFHPNFKQNNTKIWSSTNTKYQHQPKYQTKSLASQKHNYNKETAAKAEIAEDAIVSARWFKLKAPEVSTEASLEDPFGVAATGTSFSGIEGAGAGACDPKRSSGSSTWSTWYTAKLLPLNTVLATVASLTPVVKFTWFPEVVTLSGNSPSLLFPAWVRRGLLAVWNCDVDIEVGRIWNCTSWTFCWSLSELIVPDFRLAKALSVGANTVRPWFELLSCVLIWSSCWVFSSRRMKEVNWPPFSRIAVMFGGPDGAAAGTWAEVFMQWRRETRRRKNMKQNGFVILLARCFY